jgi:hypothetical protein
MMWVTIIIAALFGSVLATANSATAFWEDISDENHIRFYICTLYSPLNATYKSQFLSLNLSFTVGMGVRYTIQYYIDGEYVGELPFTVEKADELHVTYPAHAYAELSKLSTGTHSLSVFFTCSGLARSLLSNNATVYFTIDPDATSAFVPQPTVDLTPPKITNLYIQNQTSNQTETQIYFTIVENSKNPIVSYSIDGAQKLSLPDNVLVHNYENMWYYRMNLTGLLGGTHSITFYAVDAAGNSGISDTASFYVEAPEDEQSYPTVIAALIVPFSVVALGLIVNQKRKNHEANANS